MNIFFFIYYPRSAVGGLRSFFITAVGGLLSAVVPDERRL
jgi:hypothetical protein